MIYIYQLLLKVLSKEQRLPLTLSDEKHTGKVNIMEIKSTTLTDYGTLTLELKPRGEKLLDKASDGEAKARLEESISKELDNLLSAVVLSLVISYLVVPEPEKATGQHWDALFEVDSPRWLDPNDIEDWDV